jgi:hypothetical protein
MPLAVLEDLEQAKEYFYSAGADTTSDSFYRALMQPAFRLCELALIAELPNVESHFNVEKHVPGSGSSAIGAQVVGIQPCYWYLQ